MKAIMLALAAIIGCKQDAVELRSAGDFDWESGLCGVRGAANQEFHDDDAVAASVRHVMRFDCDLKTREGSVTASPAVLRGNRDPTSSWCSVQLGPALMGGPVAPDTAVAFVEDPLLATLLRSAFVGIDPRREYDLEADRGGVRISAHQHRSNDGVELTLGVDGCKPSDVPEMRHVGSELSFARR